MDLDPRAANSLSAAQRLLKADRFDLCLTDMQLPDGDGLELVKWIQQYSPTVPVAVITRTAAWKPPYARSSSVHSISYPSRWISRGCASSCKRHQAIRNERSGHQHLGPRLLGISEAMQGLRELIGRVARSQAPVHIYGESGTARSS